MDLSTCRACHDSPIDSTARDRSPHARAGRGARGVTIARGAASPHSASREPGRSQLRAGRRCEARAVPPTRHGCNNSCKKVAQLVGSYDVHSGPNWTGNPPTYTCKEACALLFGGVAGQYTCSITNAAPTGQAFMSGYADSQFCYAPNSDNFKLNSFYNCGLSGCSYSAYVFDNCSGGTSINYCWKQ